MAQSSASASSAVSSTSSIEDLAAALQQHFDQPPSSVAVIVSPHPDGDAEAPSIQEVEDAPSQAHVSSPQISLMASKLPSSPASTQRPAPSLQTNANHTTNGVSRVETMFFAEPVLQVTPGPRFEPAWAREIGGRVRKGFNSSKVCSVYPKPGHSFCQVPQWTSAADVFTRLFNTPPGRYRHVRALDDELRMLQDEQLNALGPLHELTLLLGGACRLPVEQEVSALSALAYSQAGSINNITRLRRKRVLELFEHRSACPKELLLAFEEDILNKPSDSDLFTNDMVDSLKDFLKKIVEQRSQEEQLNKLLSRGSGRTGTQSTSSGQKRRKTRRGSSNTGRKKRRLARGKEEPRDSAQRRSRPFRGSGTKGAQPGKTYGGPATGKAKAPPGPKNRYVSAFRYQLETYYQESKIAGYCSKWLNTKFYEQPRSPKAQVPVQSYTSQLNGRGHRPGAGPPGKGSHQRSRPFVRPDPLPNLLNKEELRRRLPVHLEPETPEQPHGYSELQNGEPSKRSRHGGPERLDGQGRPERRVLRGRDRSRKPKLPGLSLVGKSIPVSQDAQRVQPSSSKVHQVVKTGGGRLSSPSNSHLLLPRRRVPDRGHRSEHISRPRLCEKQAYVPRLCPERQKVFSGPLAKPRISRVQDQLQGYDVVHPRGETFTSPRNSQKAVQLGPVSNGERPRQLVGIPSSSRPSNSYCSSPLQVLAAAKNCSIKVDQKLHVSGSPGIRSPQGALLVAGLPVGGETSAHTKPARKPSCPYRDLYRQLAGHVGRFLLRRRSARVMGAKTEKPAHQRVGDSSRSESSSAFRRKFARADSCPPRGQQDSPCLPEENGGNPESSSKPCSTRNLVVATREKVRPGSPVHPIQGEPSSRPDVALPPPEKGVVPKQPRIRIANKTVGPANDRPVCVSSERKDEPVLLVGARDRGVGSECSQQPDPLAQRCAVVRVPAGELDSKNSAQVRGPEGPPADSSGTRLENAAMVPSNPGKISRPPKVPPQQGGSNPRPGRTSPPASAGKQLATSGMAGFLHRVRKEGFSTKAAEYIRLRWRKGSRRTYENYWRDWDRWCDQREIDPLSPSPAQLGENLVHLFHDKELATSSIGIARSAISSFSAPVDGAPLGEHRRICDLMKAFRNCRPPKARYSTTWSIDSLLSFWDTQPENSQLTLKLLTLKTVSLVAISSLSRADELANTLRENYGESEKGLFFLLAKAPKNHKHGPIPPISIDKIPGRPNVCPVVAVYEYIRRTQDSRDVSDDHPRDRLFLSLDSRHCNVKVGTISRWLQQAMDLAGIDTSSFKAHSIRGASVSSLRRRGSSIRQIMNKGRWKSNSVLSRFYLRTLPRYPVIHYPPAVWDWVNPAPLLGL